MKPLVKTGGSEESNNVIERKEFFFKWRKKMAVKKVEKGTKEETW